MPIGDDLPDLSDAAVDARRQRKDEERPWRWLESTRDLQREAFDWNWDVIRAGGVEYYLEQLGRSTMENITSAVAELGEVLNEVGWKPWASKRFVNRKAFIAELVDVVHFLANMIVSVDCTDDEWEEAYRAKQEINRQRQRDGYDGATDKCPSCLRAYTEHDGLASYTDVGCARVVTVGQAHYMCRATDTTTAIRLQVS
jgi:hypothetical protein